MTRRKRVAKVLKWGELSPGDAFKSLIATRGDFRVSVAFGSHGYHWRIYRNMRLQSRGTESSEAAAKQAAEAALEKVNSDD